MSGKDRSRHLSGDKKGSGKKSKDESDPADVRRPADVTPPRRSSGRLSSSLPSSPGGPPASPKSKGSYSKSPFKRFAVFRKSGSSKSSAAEASPKKHTRSSSTPPKKETPAQPGTSASQSEERSASAAPGRAGDDLPKPPQIDPKREEPEGMETHCQYPYPSPPYPTRVPGKVEYIGTDPGNLDYLASFYPPGMAPSKTPPKKIQQPPKKPSPKSTMDPDDGAVPSTSGTSAYEQHYGRELYVALPPESPPPSRAPQPPVPEETEERLRRPRRKGEPRRS